MARPTFSEDAFPSLRDQPDLRAAVESGLTFLQDLLDASGQLTNSHTVILANGISVVDTRAESYADSQGVAFDYEHQALGSLQIRFLFLGNTGQSPSKGSLATYADALFALFSQLVGSQALVRDTSAQLAHDLSIHLLAIGLLARDLRENRNVTENDTSSQVDRLQVIEAEARMALYSVQAHLASIPGKEYRSGRGEINSLAEILREIVNLVSVSSRRREINIRLRLDLTKDPRIRADSSSLRLALFSVIDNAFKYAGDGTEIVVTLISPYDPGSERKRVAVRVENVGLPIAHDEIPAIFKRGFRGRATMAVGSPGAGLGMYVVRQAMSSLAGEVRLTSTPLLRPSGASQNLTRVDLVFPSLEE